MKKKRKLRRKRERKREIRKQEREKERERVYFCKYAMSSPLTSVLDNKFI